MILADDLKRMKRVMRRLGWISRDDIVELKGKVACEVSASDEIVITELLFSGMFAEMSPHEVAAVLTCLVYDESNSQ
jgi:ATP-dependent RNA helicase DOB1